MLQNYCKILHNSHVSNLHHLWPDVSTRYNTASPLNGGLKDCVDDPAIIGLCDIVVPVAGLNHSTANFRESGMAERSIVNEPPEGA